MFNQVTSKLKDNAGATTITDRKYPVNASSKHFQIEHVSTLKFSPNFTTLKEVT